MEMFRQIAPLGVVNKQPMSYNSPTKLMEEAAEAPTVTPKKYKPPKARNLSQEPTLSESTSDRKLAGNANMDNSAQRPVAQEMGPHYLQTSKLESTRKLKPSLVTLNDSCAASSSIQKSDSKLLLKASNLGGNNCLQRPRADNVANPEEHFRLKDTEEAMRLEADEAVVVLPTPEETILTHEEIGKITPADCPFMMNKE
jgi:hypothetical protein